MPIITTGLPKDRAESAILELQPILFDLLGLFLQSKQLHWNVVGPRFKTVHEQLDEIGKSLRRHSDTVAERIVALGRATEASARNLAEKARLSELPRELIPDRHAVGLLADRLLDATTNFREHAERLRAADPVSENMILEVIQDLEKHGWMLQAQQIEELGEPEARDPGAVKRPRRHDGFEKSVKAHDRA